MAVLLAIILASPGQSGAQQTSSLNLSAIAGLDSQSSHRSGNADVSVKSLTQPKYPQAELFQGITGTVRLLLFVDERGIPTDVLVERSSGNSALDNAAESAAHDWTFNPALKNGVAVSSVSRMPVDFSLDTAHSALTLDTSSSIDEASLAALVRSAENGSVNAQNYLGQIYSTGDGVPTDQGKSAGWFQKAAAHGDAGAEYNLGVAYEHGQGVPRDMPKAIGWYEAAAAQGSALGEIALGRILSLGDGVPKDVARAIEWFGKAAAQGDAVAESCLGWIYSKSDGVPHDLRKAMDWYEKAAVQGNAMAQNNLGWMYELGQGTPHDEVLAYAWIIVAANHDVGSMAAAQGAQPPAQYLPGLEKKMTPDQLDEAKRLASSWVKGQLLSHDAK